MRKIFLFTLITIVAVALVSCADKQDNNLRQTGLIDQNGNLITNTLVKTNIIYIRDDIPEWATNIQVDYIIITNSNYTEIKYPDDILIPNLPDNPSTLYKIRVPFAGRGDGIYTVDYRDTVRLKQLWFDQINRKGMSDGKVFAIRNKQNSGNMDNFQNNHSSGNYHALDYYYFNEHGDIVSKEDNRIIKKFLGAIITEYRDFDKKEWGDLMNKGAVSKYTYKRRNVFTVGGIYAVTMSTEEARELYRERDRDDRWFDNADNPFKDGVFNFHSPRYKIQSYYDGFNYRNSMFERQYVAPGFIEVLVMNPEDNNMGYADAAGVDSYYAYYGKYGYVYPYEGTPGFQPWNMPYMTNQNIYLRERPEYTIPLLTHTTKFSDKDLSWNYLFMPGHPN